VALLRARPRGLSWPQLVAEIVERGSPDAAWDALVELSLFDVHTDRQAAVDEAAADIASWIGGGIGFHTFLDGAYPPQLREIHQMPPVLFSRGAMAADDRAVCVVGSRRASDDGLRWAADLAEGLTDVGITVVSGLAEGIDTAAHTAALSAGGRTVAVVGTGVNRVYPASNRDLQERIVQKGLVLSQFWPDAPPSKTSFPMRNATMSGYGHGTVVVEAGETSGARIQARLAVEHGRPVILTDRVVHANDWARELRSKPGVHVAATVAEVLTIVAEVTRDLDDVLSGVLADF
jgi:DNA processing protein